MRKLNNKGYMLVEIIMAFVIAFGLLYFMMELVIKLKNMNDDLMVETIVRTDQTIITNRIMEYVIEKKNEFDCNNDFKVNDNVIKYGDDVINIVSDYAIVGEKECKVDESKRTISIKIPIDVKQISNEDFDVVINYMYDIEVAYAIYSSTDKSLRFYKNYDLPSVGNTYNGLVVDAVYMGVELKKYDSFDDIPWYEKKGDINKIVFENEIKPISTAYWFYELKNAGNIDVSKLDTSNVKNMKYMFYSAGYNTNNFEIIGLEKWDVSNVTDMARMFYQSGYESIIWNIGNLASWNTSNVTDMHAMFSSAGNSANYFLDLSDWNVNLVTNHFDFNNGVLSKVKSPVWVN